MVTDAVVDFIAEDLMPLHVVDSARFQNLIKHLDPQYTLPSRKHLSDTLLVKKFDQLKQDITNSFKKVTVINLTIDLWSNRQMHSFLGITAHYITDTWKLEHVVLGCNRVHGRHTADNIQLWFDEVVSKFGICHKIKHIVTDSGANIKKAFALPGYEVDRNSENEDSSDEDEDFEPVSAGSLDGYLFEHHACFAHILQLVIKDGMKKAGQITTVIRRCAKLVSFVRKSTIAADVLEKEYRLQNDNLTRWNSQLKMIRSVLKVPEDKLALLGDAPTMTSHDRNVLKDLVEILTPFEDATDIVQTSNVPSAGYVLPCVRGLLHHIDNCYTKFHSSFVQALRASLVARMSSYESNDSYVIAAILDPRFKLRWCVDSGNKVRNQELLKLESRKWLTSSAIGDQSDGRNGEEPPPKKIKGKGLFDFMEEPTSESLRSSNDSDIENYLSAPCQPMTINPASYWKENGSEYGQTLPRMAKEILSIPSSSAPVERLFSIAGKVFTPSRSRLKDSRFEQLMF